MGIVPPLGFGQSGLRDWLWQRISAIILFAYLSYVGYILLGTDITYDKWLSLWQTMWFKGASIIVLLALLIHSWIGIWTVTTDYLKIIWVRLLAQIIVIFYLLLLLIWGLYIILYL